MTNKRKTYVFIRNHWGFSSDAVKTVVCMYAATAEEKRLQRFHDDEAQLGECEMPECRLKSFITKASFDAVLAGTVSTEHGRTSAVKNNNQRQNPSPPLICQCQCTLWQRDAGYSCQISTKFRAYIGFFQVKSLTCHLDRISFSVAFSPWWASVVDTLIR